ncbi:S8 family serine peptidase [Halegenticoccus tardaugens]|uniref:S8 family serine peptidase n=1 Tax=Halegenticoccus tardaugens TaxID=2071624 RepID=UPI00100AC910|nr:S8 family serine peptidase [Halegenticoccus tardaugens]
MTDRTKFTTLTRRTVLKTTGAASLAPFAGVASAGGLSDVVDDTLDAASDALQEALVVFASNDDVDRLGALDLAEGYLAFEVLPVGYATLTGAQIETVAGWPEVRRVQANRELEYYNDDGREVTGVETVQSADGYTGESAHAVVIDSGVDGDHPDLADAIDANYQWAGNPLGDPTLWVDAGPADTDEIGHGTHCSGTVAGDGSASDGRFRGMAPDATLTSYSTGLAITILKAAAAYDHMLANGDGETYQVVSNSYGASSGEDFDPDDALSVATWHALDAGILPVFAAGNDGDDYGTLNDYAKAPHVLGVAATRDDKSVTDFSSRGREDDNHDRETAHRNLEAYYDGDGGDDPLGLYRPGVGAPGNEIVSTMSPDDPLQAQSADDGRLYYATISGTSMACPHATGIATLVVDAYRENHGAFPDPLDVLNTVEAEAYDARDGYEPASVGAGFVDAAAAVERAEADALAGFDDVTLVD